MDKEFKRKFIKGSLITSIGQVSSLSLQFITTIIVVRSIIKQDFGIFSLILVISIFLAIIGGLGLNTTLVKYLSSSNSETQSDNFQDLLGLRIMSLIIISTFFFIISNVIILFDPQVNNFILQIIIIFVLSSLREFYYAQLQGLRRFKEFAIVQFSSALSKFIAIIIGSSLGLINLKFLIYAEIGVLLFSFVIQQFIVPLNIKINFVFKISKIKNILKFAYPLYLNNLLAVVNNRTNAFIITGFLGTISLAYYEVAGKIPNALRRIFNSFILVFFPNISYLISNDRKKDAHKFINSSILSINVLLLPVIIVIYLFQNEITIILFTDQYIESSLAIFLFMIAFYFSTVSSITGYSLVALNKNLLSFRCNLFGVLTGLVVSVVLIPLLGFEGAVFGIISSRFISSGLGIFYLNKQSIKVSYIKTILPLLFCAPFIITYEIIGFNEILYKFILVVIFFLIEIISFKEFRNILIKIVGLLKTSVISNMKRLTKLK